MIAVVDYKMGNLLSVERGVRAALESTGHREGVIITSDADEIACASAIVLPGVGAFADAEASMRKLCQKDVITQRIRDGVPFLGICLGLHLLCEFGVEGTGDEQPASGMCFVAETVDRLPAHDGQGNFYKVPHVGWNTVESNDQVELRQCRQSNNNASEQMLDFSIMQKNKCASKKTHEQMFACQLFEGINPGEFFYFTHSYFVPVCEQTIATTTHSVAFSSAVQIAPRAFGVQFHPEKSSDAGAQLLQNFVRIALASC